MGLQSVSTDFVLLAHHSWQGGLVRLVQVVRQNKIAAGAIAPQIELKIVFRADSAFARIGDD